jgi:hypothetical protein
MTAPTDLATVIAELKRTANALDDNAETYDDAALWPLLQAIEDANKVVRNELVQRMLDATKEA